MGNHREMKTNKIYSGFVTVYIRVLDRRMSCIEKFLESFLIPTSS